MADSNMQSHSVSFKLLNRVIQKVWYRGENYADEERVKVVDRKKRFLKV